MANQLSHGHRPVGNAAGPVSDFSPSPGRWCQRFTGHRQYAKNKNRLR